MTNYADLCAAIYTPIRRGFFSHIVANSTAIAGVYPGKQETVVAFAGTQNFVDTLDDLDIEQEYQAGLGLVHKGMFRGIPDILMQLRPYLDGNLVITGHSLGASHAAFVTALCGVPVAHTYLFAPPRMSAEPFLKTPVSAYRNGIDPVPLVPLGDDWCDIAPLIPLDVKPPGFAEDMDPIEWHHVSLYVQGFGALA